MGNGIIIYQNLLAFLLRSCGESGGLSVMPPDVLDPLNQSLQELSKTMRSDPVSALIHSAEHRARLLQIAERLALKYTSQLQEQLHLDGEQMARHVVDLVDSADNKAAVLSLRDEEAQRFLDAVDDILSNSSISHTDAWRIQRLMLKLSESSGKLPLALFVRNISHCDRYFRERGGFGEVYQASLNGRTVALKRLSTSLTANIEDQRRAQVRFCREVFTWRRLRHKFVLPLMGVDRDTFPPFLAMVSPWMEHGTALDYSRKNGIGSVDRLLFEIAQGLSYLHSMNIVHGDLRGANVLINDDHACLADFGLAAFAETIDTVNPSTSNRAGSIQWMAPELIDPKRFGHERFVRTTASDAYAFGCVCVELYTGLPPLAGLTEVAVLLKVISGQRPSRPSELASDALWDWVTKFWAENAQDRPQVDAVISFMGGLCGAPEEFDKGLTSTEPMITRDALGVHNDALGSRPDRISGGTAFSKNSSYASGDSTFWTERFPRRFLVLKSPDEQTADWSVQTGMWITSKHNGNLLDHAYRTAEEVFLVISVKKSGEFYGYARMASSTGDPTLEQDLQRLSLRPVPDLRRIADADSEAGLSAADDAHLQSEVLADEAKDLLRVAWCSTTRIPFKLTRHIRNPWNHDREVQFSRDGTELEPETGEKLLKIWRAATAGGGAVELRQ